MKKTIIKKNDEIKTEVMGNIYLKKSVRKRRNKKITKEKRRKENRKEIISKIRD